MKSSDNETVIFVGAAVVLLFAAVIVVMDVFPDKPVDLAEVHTVRFSGRIELSPDLPGITFDEYWWPSREEIIAMEENMPDFPRAASVTFCERRRAEFFDAVGGALRRYTGFVQDGREFVYSQFETDPGELSSPSPRALVYDAVAQRYIDLVWSGDECAWLNLERSGSNVEAQVEAEARLHALLWLQVVDEGLYPQSWQLAAPALKDSFSVVQWDNAMEFLRSNLGALHSRSNQRGRYSIGADGARRVVLRFDSDFEATAGMTETLTMELADDDGKWKVAGYVIH